MTILRGPAQYFGSGILMQTQGGLREYNIECLHGGPGCIGVENGQVFLGNWTYPHWIAFEIDGDPVEEVDIVSIEDVGPGEFNLTIETGP